MRLISVFLLLRSVTRLDNFWYYIKHFFIRNKRFVTPGVIISVRKASIQYILLRSELLEERINKSAMNHTFPTDEYHSSSEQKFSF